jgi:hypothetical protein
LFEQSLSVISTFFLKKKLSVYKADVPTQKGYAVFASKWKLNSHSAGKCQPRNFPGHADWQLAVAVVASLLQCYYVHLFHFPLYMRGKRRRRRDDMKPVRDLEHSTRCLVFTMPLAVWKHDTK